ncbi:MAG: hypothetical protein ACHQM4_12190 [Thermoanaerobaculia bacterium]
MLLVLAAALSFALPAAAKIDTILINHVSGPALCGSFAANPELDGSTLSQTNRILVPRGATFLVEMDGFGADFATGTQDDISGLSSSIVGHGSRDKIGGGIFFGQPEKTGYVAVQIVAGTSAALGNGNVQVNWLTGHEVIPMTVVASCAPPPTPRPMPTSAPGGAFIPRQLGAVAASPTLLPDLTPTDFVNFRTCNATSFGTCVPNPNDCNGAFTGQRRFTQPDLQYGVRNISGVPVTTAFAVVLKKKDGSQLARNTVPNLAANGSATFTFHRANSDVCVQQIGPNKVCTYCAVAIDDTGIEVVVDSDNAIAEASETNNSRKIQ